MALGAIAVLVVNDHLLKPAFASWWTGKLSDVAGLVFFPLMLQAGWETGQRLLRRPATPSRRMLVAAIVATALVFSAVQVWGPAADAYRYGLGALQWPFHSVSAVVGGRGLPSLRPVSVTPDPTDLVTVPAVAVALAIGWGRCAPNRPDATQRGARAGSPEPHRRIPNRR